MVSHRISESCSVGYSYLFPSEIDPFITEFFIIVPPKQKKITKMKVLFITYLAAGVTSVPFNIPTAYRSYMYHAGAGKYAGDSTNNINVPNWYRSWVRELTGQLLAVRQPRRWHH